MVTSISSSEQMTLMLLMLFIIFRSICSNEIFLFQGAILWLRIRKSNGLKLLTEKKQKTGELIYVTGSQEPASKWTGGLKDSTHGQNNWLQENRVFSFIPKWGHLSLSEDRESGFEPDGWLKKTVFLYSLKGCPQSTSPTETMLYQWPPHYTLHQSYYYMTHPASPHTGLPMSGKSSLLCP